VILAHSGVIAGVSAMLRDRLRRSNLSWNVIARAKPAAIRPCFWVVLNEVKDLD
jgi:hypothetical protein